MVRCATMALWWTLCSAYVFIEDMDVVVPKVLATCDTIDPVLKDIVDAAASFVPGMFIVPHTSNMDNSGYICTDDTPMYAYTRRLVNDTQTNITIANTLLSHPTTLHNVVLHELLHSMGLDHTQQTGMMNYSLRAVYMHGDVHLHDDERRLWLSLDDMRGLSARGYSYYVG